MLKKINEEVMKMVSNVFLFGSKFDRTFEGLYTSFDKLLQVFCAISNRPVTSYIFELLHYS